MLITLYEHGARILTYNEVNLGRHQETRLLHDERHVISKRVPCGCYCKQASVESMGICGDLEEQAQIDRVVYC